MRNEIFESESESEFCHCRSSPFPSDAFLPTGYANSECKYVCYTLMMCSTSLIKENARIV